MSLLSHCLAASVWMLVVCGSLGDDRSSSGEEHGDVSDDNLERHDPRVFKKLRIRILQTKRSPERTIMTNDSDDIRALADAMFSLEVRMRSGMARDWIADAVLTFLADDDSSRVVYMRHDAWRIRGSEIEWPVTPQIAGLFKRVIKKHSGKDSRAN